MQNHCSQSMRNYLAQHILFDPTVGSGHVSIQWFVQWNPNSVFLPRIQPWKTLGVVTLLLVMLSARFRLKCLFHVSLSTKSDSKMSFRHFWAKDAASKSSKNTIKKHQSKTFAKHTETHRFFLFFGLSHIKTQKNMSTPSYPMKTDLAPRPRGKTPTWPWRPCSSTAAACSMPRARLCGISGSWRRMRKPTIFWSIPRKIYINLWYEYWTDTYFLMRESFMRWHDDIFFFRFVFPQLLYDYWIFLWVICLKQISRLGGPKAAAGRTETGRLSHPLCGGGAEIGPWAGTGGSETVPQKQKASV